MNRRHFFGHLGAGFAAAAFPTLARAMPEAAIGPSVIAAWRGATGSAKELGDYVGILRPDWERGQLEIRLALAVPERVHGLAAFADGGFIAVAYRPGKWLLRVNAGGEIAARRSLRDEDEHRTLDGHAVLSPLGDALITTETNAASGEGWASVRDPMTLKRLAQWRTHGIEPHDARFDRSGALLVANGGILRGPGDRKRDLDRMSSSLVRLDIRNGELLGQWRLSDPRLSLRHLAVSDVPTPGGIPLVGIAMQAEHDDDAQRRAAPILATWDGEGLVIPSYMPLGAGYCSDIAPGPNGGFYLNGERSHRAFLWSPENPSELLVIAELERAGALATLRQDGHNGVVIAASRGLARWHPTMAPSIIRWPAAMTPDNHWIAMPA